VVSGGLSAISMRRAGADPQGFACALGDSFERYGFAVVSDHGLDAALIAAANAKVKAFFALPESAKRAYHVAGGGGQRGYTPFGVEAAKGATHMDLKEFWHIGRELDPPSRHGPGMPANLWPLEIESFRDTLYGLFSALDALGLSLLDAIGAHLGLAPHFFRAAVHDGNSILRLLHYPPVTGPVSGIRAEAHEDINVITLLLGAEEGGLQLRDNSGAWIDVNPRAGELVVNIGDMLARLTNERLPSTTHRVINPRPERAQFSRYSIPFFLHFAPEFEIRTLLQCVDAAHPDRFPQSITAQEFLMQRLREIRLA
jgi:isopenicillin N synthase-like dioxygenase